MGQQNQKLFTTIAGVEILDTNTVPADLGKLAQYRVTDIVTIGIIDAFEMAISR